MFWTQPSKIYVVYTRSLERYASWICTPAYEDGASGDVEKEHDRGRPAEAAEDGDCDCDGAAHGEEVREGKPVNQSDVVAV